MVKRQAREAREQQALIHWAQYHPLIDDHLIAIPNGGSRHPAEAVNLKQQGVKAGVFDLFFAIPNDDYAGLWIEMKAKQRNGRYGQLSPKQKAWQARMQAVGYSARVAYEFEQAKAMILNYLKHSPYENGVELCGNISGHP